MGDRIHYLNTDLELTADEDLSALAAAMEARGVSPLRIIHDDGDGHWRAWLETDTEHDEPETNIAAMLAVIEELPEPLRAVWARCTRRVLNIGYCCGDRPRAFNQGLSPELLRRIATVGAALVITLYPEEREDGG